MHKTNTIQFSRWTWGLTREGHQTKWLFTPVLWICRKPTGNFWTKKSVSELFYYRTHRSKSKIVRGCTLINFRKRFCRKNTVLRIKKLNRYTVYTWFFYFIRCEQLRRLLSKNRNQLSFGFQPQSDIAAKTSYFTSFDF